MPNNPINNRTSHSRHGTRHMLRSSSLIFSSHWKKSCQSQASRQQAYPYKQRRKFSVFLNRHLFCRQEACIPSIPAAHEAHNLLISLNRQPGPSQVQEPKEHEPCGSPSTAPQRHNLRTQPHKLPLAQAKPSCPSSGPCHDISPAHAELTPGPC
ncbi:hypothetical protein C1H46_036339 [Malus baccata]|uniref:Uncharacterized protein n=1 Tax=Malus baccata TaxID=106549 RepID=A0A540KVF4_MALBA|nr:hypothetical protein C1H46_036339 [Malus baccata]